LICAWHPQAASADGFTGYAWTASTAGSGEDRELAAVAMSGDGDSVLVGFHTGEAYLSQDGGATWNAISPSGVTTTQWSSCSMSADGVVRMMGTNGTHLYVSTNSGASWSEVTLNANVSYSWRVRVSSDGGTLVAMAENGRVYRSTDGGAHWSEMQPAGDAFAEWRAAATSSNGSTILLATDDSVYRSTNTGATWTLLQNPDDAYGWRSLAVSGDGRVALAGDDDGNFFRLLDGGTTWAAIDPNSGAIDTGDWKAVAISADGTRMVACQSSGLYTSSDGGENWYYRYLDLGNWNNSLEDVAISTDGTRIVAGQEDGTIHIGQPNSLPTVIPVDAYAKDIMSIVVSSWVTDPGDSEVISRGVCWNTSGNPTVADHRVDIGSGLGQFSTVLEDLAAGTTYHVRAFATNSQGTAYGREAEVALYEEGKTFWTRAQPVDATASWMVGGISGNGKVMVAQDGTGQKAYISRDYGCTWSELDLPATMPAIAELMLLCQSVLSYDGSVILMPILQEHLKGEVRISMMLSTDTGETWTRVLSDVGGLFTGLAISNDGQVLHVINMSEDQLYRSTNGGVDWTTIDLPFEAGTLCASADGSRVFVLASGVLKDESEFGVYASSDGGATWAKLLEEGGNAFSIASSADGTHLYVAGRSVIASHDGGATWSQSQPAGQAQSMFIRVACSSDGQTVLLGGIGGLYLSTDGATTWGAELCGSQDLGAAVSELAIWDVVNVSADGKQMFAARFDNKLYVGGDPSVQSVTTSAATELSESSAVVGGVIDVQRFVPITARGVCWNLTGEPNLEDDAYTTDGEGGGEFSTTLTNLCAGTTYHVRAYAVSPMGTVYGDEITFKTTGVYNGPDLLVSIESGDGSGSGSGGGSGGQHCYVGQQARFLIRILNRGSGGATGVNVIIPIPEGTEFVSAEPIIESSDRISPKDVTVSDNQVIITLPQLAPNEQVSVLLVVRALVAGEISLTASATSAELGIPAEIDDLVVDVAEGGDYYQIVTGAPMCGAAGLTPLLGAMLLLGFMGRRSRV
jgi:uncharacterized repeat protein (TIGR01451 family)